MKRKSEEKVGSLLELFVRQNGLEEGLAEYRLVKAWSELLPPLIVKKTSDLKVHDRTLFVKLGSSVVRSELSMMHDSLLEKLNEAAGMEVIDQIVFR